MADRTPIPAGAYERLVRKFKSDAAWKESIERMNAAAAAEKMVGRHSIGPDTSRRADPNLISASLAGAPVAGALAMIGRGAAPMLKKAAPAVGRALVQGSTHPGALSAGAGIGGGLEYALNDKASIGDILGASALGALDVANPVASIGAQVLGHSPESQAGLMSGLMKFLRAGVEPQYVVKPRGGNWINGSVEGALSGLKTGPGPDAVNALLRARPGLSVAEAEAFVQSTQPIAPESLALNSWIDKQLAKYVRNDMATPEDPLRLLAETFPERKAAEVKQLQAQLDKAIAKRDTLQSQRGVPEEYLTRSNAEINALRTRMAEANARRGIHYDPRVDAAMRRSASAEAHRTMADYQLPGSGRLMGTTPLSARWEDLTDAAITPGTYEQSIPFREELTPEALRVVGGEFAVKNPQATAHSANRGISNSGLGFPHLIDELSNALNPSSGLPKNLLLDAANLGKITPAQAAEHVDKINAHRAVKKIEADRAIANMGSTVREYTENNPRGFKWVELKKGEELPEGWTTYDDPITGSKLPVTPEGRTITGNENDPRYKTLEQQLKYEGDMLQHCVGGYCPDVLEGRSRIFSLRDADGKPQVTVEVEPTPERYGYDQVFGGLQDNLGRTPTEAEVIQELARLNVGPPSIKQIKSLRNGKPADELLPYVQDFVRNNPLGGQWGDVGDLYHTGLYRKNTLSPDESKAFPDKDYLTMDEIKALRAGKPWTPIDTDPDFASGGSVHKHNSNEQFQGIINALEQELANAAY